MPELRLVPREAIEPTLPHHDAVEGKKTPIPQTDELEFTTHEPTITLDIGDLEEISLEEAAELEKQLAASEVEAKVKIKKFSEQDTRGRVSAFEATGVSETPVAGPLDVVTAPSLHKEIDQPVSEETLAQRIEKNKQFELLTKDIDARCQAAFDDMTVQMEVIEKLENFASLHGERGYKKCVELVDAAVQNIWPKHSYPVAEKNYRAEAYQLLVSGDIHTFLQHIVRHKNIKDDLQLAELRLEYIGDVDDTLKSKSPNRKPSALSEAPRRVSGKRTDEKSLPAGAVGSKRAKPRSDFDFRKTPPPEPPPIIIDLNEPSIELVRPDEKPKNKKASPPPPLARVA